MSGDRGCGRPLVGGDSGPTAHAHNGRRGESSGPCLLHGGRLMARRMSLWPVKISIRPPELIHFLGIAAESVRSSSRSPSRSRRPTRSSLPAAVLPDRHRSPIRCTFSPDVGEGDRHRRTGITSSDPSAEPGRFLHVPLLATSTRENTAMIDRASGTIPAARRPAPAPPTGLVGHAGHRADRGEHPRASSTYWSTRRPSSPKGRWRGGPTLSSPGEWSAR